MPGLTNNTDLLAGVNQLISSLNELITTTAAQQLSTSVTCTPDVNVTCGGGVPISDTPPITEPVGQGDDPPPGWSEASQTIVNRKCKAANYQVDKMIILLDTLIIHNVQAYIDASVSIAIAGISFLLVSSIVGPFIAGIAATLGWVSGVVEVLISETVDLDSLKLAIENNRDDLVCALYDATDVLEAKEGFIDVLSVAGVSAGNLALVDAIAQLYWFGTLFFKYDDFIEAELDGYTPTTDCDGCASGCFPELCIPTDNDAAGNGTFTEQSETVVDVVSGQVSTVYWAICDFNTDPNSLGFCGPGVKISSYSLTGFTPDSPAGYRVYDSNLSLIYSSNTPPTWSSLSDIRRVQLKSTTPFTGTITVQHTDLEVYSGSIVGQNGNTYTIQSVSSDFGGGNFAQFIGLRYDGGTLCKTTSIGNYQNWASPPAVGPYCEEGRNDQGGTVFSTPIAGSPPTRTNQCIALFYAIGNNSSVFTIDVTVGSECIC